MTGLYIFGVFLAAVIVAFIIFKVRWSRADRAEEQRQSLALEAELDAEEKRKQAKIS